MPEMAEADVCETQENVVESHAQAQVIEAQAQVEQARPNQQDLTHSMTTASQNCRVLSSKCFDGSKGQSKNEEGQR